MTDHGSSFPIKKKGVIKNHTAWAGAASKTAPRPSLPGTHAQVLPCHAKQGQPM